MKLWDTRTWELRQTLTEHQGTIKSVAFSSDGKTLFTGSLDKTIRLWRIK